MLNFLASVTAVASDALTATTSAVSGATSSASSTDSIMSMVTSFGFFAVLIVAMYFILIRPQRKKEKEQKLMRSAIEVGDEIVTIGGISGHIVSIKDDAVIIESGSDRDKVKIMKWAIQTVTTLHDTTDVK